MKTLKLLALSIIAILFASCKASQPTGPPSGGTTPVSLIDVHDILDSTEITFAKFINTAGNTPQQAIILTESWLNTEPTVQSAFDIDSAYLYITLKSGLTTMFSFDQKGPDGLSLSRGGHANNKTLARVTKFTPSQHTMTNKSVLIYAAAYSEFYFPGEMQTVLNFMKNSDIAPNVTLLTDQQCTYQTIDNLSSYGLVILDTHGCPDAVLTGSQVVIPFGLSNDSIYAAMINAQAGAGTTDKIASGDLRLGTFSSLKWHAPYVLPTTDTARIWVTSKHVASLSNLSNTIIFGNMCYSGISKNYTAPISSAIAPIGTAFTSLNPISYFCYGYDNGASDGVDDVFAKQMEDTLIWDLFIDNDSTGFAYQQYDATRFFDPSVIRPLFGNFYFKQYGSANYCYTSDSMVDTRDGQSYKTTPIGTQTWMAQNLNYNAPGSMCYDNDPKNGAILGRLYPWDVAMAGAPSDSSNPGKVQGVCPKGWHVPSLSEWNQLAAALGTSIELNSTLGGALESTLKDTSAGGWIASTDNFTATNSTGFSALPGGGFFWDTTSPPLGTPTFHFYGKSKFGMFLTSTLVPAGQIWGGRVNALQFGFDGESSIFQRQGNPDDAVDPYQPSMNASCRCVKDP